MKEREECARCIRHVRRIATFEPAWTNCTQIVLVVSHASRATQAAQYHDPRLVDAAHRIEIELGLLNGSVAIDHLLACGLERDLSADHVAACGERFCAQAAPRIVVLLGEQTRVLAQGAGLVRGSLWEPYGSPWKADVLFASLVDDALITELSKRLGVQTIGQPAPSRVGAAHHAQLLYALLGPHRGHKRKYPGKRNWSTSPTHQILVNLVTRHLDGRLFASAFHPFGEWGYVVIDIDRHNALQAKAFDDTITAVMNEFQHGIIIQSSDSGGVHVYIRLPEYTTYEEGALVVGYHLAKCNLRWLQSSTVRRVRSLRVEVPTDPPRLPFGVGSSFIGDSRPIAAQIPDFCQQLQGASSANFETVRKQAYEELDIQKGGWSVAKARRLRAKIDAYEVEGLPNAKFDANHPLANLAPLLSEDLRKVAAFGIPMYGTRVRWVQELAEELGRLTPPNEAAGLIERWLRECHHVSADLEVDFERVVQDARTTTVRLARSNGVPKRIWVMVRRQIELVHKRMNDPSSRGDIEKRRKRSFSKAGRIGDITLDCLQRTAFHVLQMFCRGTPGYRKPIRVRHVANSVFGKFATKNQQHDIELALTDEDSFGRYWLVYFPAKKRKAMAGKRRVRRYRLADRAWPIRPHEPRIYQPH